MKKFFVLTTLCMPLAFEVSARSVGGDIKHFFEKDVPKAATKTWQGIEQGANTFVNTVGKLDLSGKVNNTAALLKKWDADSGGLGTMAAMIAFPEGTALLNMADQMSASFAAGDDQKGLEIGLNALMSHYVGTNPAQLKQLYEGVKKGNPESITEAVQLMGDFGSTKAGQAFSDRISLKNPAFKKALSDAHTLMENTPQALAIGQAVSKGNYDLALAEAMMAAANR